MYIITSKSNLSFGTIAKAMGVKMTAKAIGKNSGFYFSVKNNKRLLDEVLVISRIIKVDVGVISRSRRLRLITLDYSGYHKNRI